MQDATLEHESWASVHEKVTLFLCPFNVGDQWIAREDMHLLDHKNLATIFLLLYIK